MFKAHHAPYQGSGISTHFPLPMQKRLSYGNFQQRAAYRDKTSHALFATGGYEWFLHSFSRYPSRRFAVANYFAATELVPAVARAFNNNKLKTLRQDASSWLLKYRNTPLPACCLQRSAKPVKHRTTPVLPCVCLPKTVISHCCRNRPAL